MRKTLVIVVPLLLFIAPYSDCKAEEAFADTNFTGVVEIVFKNHLGTRKLTPFAVLKDKNDISRILKTIVLNRKAPCKCEHLEVALFKKEGSEIYVHFCSHCFVIRHGKTNVWFEMPAAFYAHYKTLLENHKKDNPTTGSTSISRSARGTRKL